jgi:hypothetical protein
MTDSSDPSEIPMVVTDPEIERILQALGAKFVPADLDRNQLAADLSRAALGYGVRKLFQDPPSEEAVQERLSRLERQIDALYKELPTSGNRLDWELLNILDNTEGAFHGSVSRFCAHLRWLKTLVERARERDSIVITPFTKEPFGAEYWLFGQELATTFARHFQREAGYSRVQRASGPYVRFACAVAVLLGVRKSTGEPYGPETIAKAIAAYRKLGKTELGID